MKRKNNKQLFESGWKNEGFMSRCLPLRLTPDSDTNLSLLALYDRFKDGINAVNHRLFDKVKNDTLDFNALRTTPVLTSLQKENKDILQGKLGFELSRSWRGIINMSRRMFYGFKTRNKSQLPHRAPRIKRGKAICLEEGAVSHKNDILSIATFGPGDGKEKGKRIRVGYAVTEPARHLIPLIPKNCGGNLKYLADSREWVFYARVKLPIKWSFEPVSPLGFDINKTSQYFMTFSEPIEFNGVMTRFVPHTPRMKKLIAKLKYLNQEIKSEEVRHKQRRYLRRKVENIHNILKKLCRAICKQVLAWCLKNKSLLCIDKLGCGARTGSFCQDKVISILTEECENNGYPFVHVHTPWTTKVCFKCKEKRDRARNGRDPHHIECPTCGLLPSHENASCNIAEWGWKVWQDGVEVVSAELATKYKRKLLVAEESK